MNCQNAVAIPDESRWAVILAGGEGARLRPFTRVITGDERPKQFCALLGKETLLQQTVGRVARAVLPGRTKLVLTRSHEQFFDSRTKEAETSAIVQPENRGTAPAILYSLLAIGREDPHAQVGLFPADHYHSDDVAFTRYVDFAFQAAARQPELVILLGVVPTRAEIEYGWIQPGEPVRGVLDGTLFRVRRFWEKPRLEVARDLLAHGFLWNSFVVVGTVQSLLDLIRGALPKLYVRFASARAAIGTAAEQKTIEKTYAQIASLDFSREVLSACPKALSVLPVANTGWTDMGSVDRVLAALASCDHEPADVKRAS